MPDDQQFAWQVQDILVGCGLGRSVRVPDGFIYEIPHVLAVHAGPPVRLKIRILPGQSPDHYAAHAPTIAYNLGMAEVRVVPLEPYLIWLELLPKPD